MYHILSHKVLEKNVLCIFWKILLTCFRQTRKAQIKANNSMYRKFWATDHKLPSTKWYRTYNIYFKSNLSVLLPFTLTQRARCNSIGNKSSPIRMISFRRFERIYDHRKTRSFRVDSSNPLPLTVTDFTIRRSNSSLSASLRNTIDWSCARSPQHLIRLMGFPRRKNNCQRFVKLFRSAATSLAKKEPRKLLAFIINAAGHLFFYEHKIRFSNHYPLQMQNTKPARKVSYLTWTWYAIYYFTLHIYNNIVFRNLQILVVNNYKHILCLPILHK